MSENDTLNPAGSDHAETAPAAPMSVAPAPAAASINPLLADEEPSPETAFDALFTKERGIEEPDLSVLATLGGETLAAEAPATAAASYGFDRDIAEGGKEFAWPKLGAGARLGLKKLGCKAWKKVMAKAVKEFGDDTGNIPTVKFAEILPELMVLSVFAWMKGVVIELDEHGNPMPPLEDTAPNRLKLLKDFEDLAGEILVACKNPKNFRDRSDAVLKN